MKSKTEIWESDERHRGWDVRGQLNKHFSKRNRQVGNSRAGLTTRSDYRSKRRAFDIGRRGRDDNMELKRWVRKLTETN